MPEQYPPKLHPAAEAAARAEIQLMCSKITTRGDSWALYMHEQGLLLKFGGHWLGCAGGLLLEPASPCRGRLHFGPNCTFGPRLRRDPSSGIEARGILHLGPTCPRHGAGGGPQHPHML